MFGPYFTTHSVLIIISIAVLLNPIEAAPDTHEYIPFYGACGKNMDPRVYDAGSFETFGTKN